MPNVQFCIKLLQEIRGRARELKLSERGSSRNRENRSHRNRRESLSEEVWQGRELPKSRQEAFLANARALPAMV